MIRSLWSEVRDMDDDEIRAWLVRVPGVVLEDGVKIGLTIGKV